MPINAINTATVATSAKGKLEYFANLKDNELLYLAQNQALLDRKTRKQQSTTRTLIKTVPVVDSVMAVSDKSKAMGLVGLGSLSTSLAAFAGRLTSWALFFGGFALADKLYAKAADKSETISKVDEKHPIVRPLAELALVLGTYNAGRKYKSNLLNLIPASIKDTGIKKLNSLKDIINSSKIATNIYEPLLKRFSGSASKYPKLASNLKAFRPFVLPALIFGSLLKTAVIDPLRYSQKVANNYIALKDQQDVIRIALEPEAKEANEIEAIEAPETLELDEINAATDVSNNEIVDNEASEKLNQEEVEKILDETNELEDIDVSEKTEQGEDQNIEDAE